MLTRSWHQMKLLRRMKLCLLGPEQMARPAQQQPQSLMEFGHVPSARKSRRGTRDLWEKSSFLCGFNNNQQPQQPQQPQPPQQPQQPQLTSTTTTTTSRLVAMDTSGQPVSGAAQRRKQGRLRWRWRHEQQSIAVALATVTHHS